jgi:hypothetical protein
LSSAWNSNCRSSGVSAGQRCRRPWRTDSSRTTIRPVPVCSTGPSRGPRRAGWWSRRKHACQGERGVSAPRFADFAKAALAATAERGPHTMRCHEIGQFTLPARPLVSGALVVRRPPQSTSRPGVAHTKQRGAGIFLTRNGERALLELVSPQDALSWPAGHPGPKGPERLL